MSVLSLVLLSTSPLLGFAVLLGMYRLERFLLDDREHGAGDELATEAVRAALAAAPASQAMSRTRRTAA